ncbi:hypothetical protein [Haloferula sp. BvORR071]|uniref:hypothetical protein n=1 Tax=Haloferula sp. BvORR071 TaxID=1396141 RepID=UPI0005552331|nr:hypothetical protein [Haloferula sp. BvORR071]
MKPNPLIVSLLVAVATLSAARATVTIVFNDPFDYGMSSNLANTAGVVSNGMKYGIIVDTTGNGIRGTYDPLALTQGTSVQLTNLGSGTGDFLILANDLTSDTSQGGNLFEGDSTTPGGNGGVSGVNFTLGGGVTTGQTFWLVWFDSVTNKGGSLASAEFVVPADGQTVECDQVFLGVDPVRPATSIAFYEASSIPEASSFILGLLGAFGLLRRRR